MVQIEKGDFCLKKQQTNQRSEPPERKGAARLGSRALARATSPGPGEGTLRGLLLKATGRGTGPCGPCKVNEATGGSLGFYCRVFCT